MKFGVGQKVRVRDYDELIKEFGANENGDIEINEYLFERDMREYCNKEYRIFNCFKDNTYDLATGDNLGYLFHEKVLESAYKSKE